MRAPPSDALESYHDTRWRGCSYSSVEVQWAYTRVPFDCVNEWSVYEWFGRREFNPRSSHTKDSKMALDAALLSTLHYKVQIKGEVEQSRERSSALPYTSV